MDHRDPASWPPLGQWARPGTADVVLPFAAQGYREAKRGFDPDLWRDNGRDVLRRMRSMFNDRFIHRVLAGIGPHVVMVTVHATDIGLSEDMADAWRIMDHASVEDWFDAIKQLVGDAVAYIVLQVGAHGRLHAHILTSMGAWRSARGVIREACPRRSFRGYRHILGLLCYMTRPPLPDHDYARGLYIGAARRGGKRPVLRRTHNLPRRWALTPQVSALLRDIRRQLWPPVPSLRLGRLFALPREGTSSLRRYFSTPNPWQRQETGLGRSVALSVPGGSPNASQDIALDGCCAEATTSTWFKWACRMCRRARPPPARPAPELTRRICVPLLRPGVTQPMDRHSIPTALGAAARPGKECCP